MTQQPVELALTFNGKVSQLASSDSLLTFQTATLSSTQIDTLTYQIVDDSTLTVEIPADTKTLVSKFFITPHSFKEIAILTDGNSQRFSTDQINKHVSVKQGLFNPITYTFKID